MSRKGTEVIIPNESTSVVQVSYNHETKILTVEYKGGDAYPYSGVPASVWERLRNAESIGSYVATRIRGFYSEAISDTQARAGRKALKLLRELNDHVRDCFPSDHNDNVISTMSTFDQPWFAKVKKLLSQVED